QRYKKMETNRTPKVMGIININNESFYKGSRCLNINEIDIRIKEMLANGADIIDIGACSTRPGSTPISMEQEWEYLKEPLKFIAKEFLSGNKYINSKNISIDTFHSKIVRRVYDILGEFIVNDISAGEDDVQMLKTVGELNLPYIAMHKRGTPNTMQQLCNYPNGVVNEVISYFIEFEERASKYGIKDYIIDPGFGFAKTIEQNYELFNGIAQIKETLYKKLGIKRDILVGISRKGMIWKPLNITPDEALCGTVALNLQALLNGANIIRVHDIKEGMQCIKLQKLIKANCLLA
ncbi:MAG: dihydropteroate synthase, partial [Bacteroidales bacterium]